MTSDASDMYIYKDEEEEEAPIIEAFPSFLVQLTNLRELNISFQFMKEIPDDVAYLSNLRVLRCSENKWPLAVVVMPRIASITPKIARLTKLEVLDFHNNCLVYGLRFVCMLGRFQRSCSVFQPCCLWTSAATTSRTSRMRSATSSR